MNEIFNASTLVASTFQELTDKILRVEVNTISSECRTSRMLNNGREIIKEDFEQADATTICFAAGKKNLKNLPLFL